MPPFRSSLVSLLLLNAGFASGLLGEAISTKSPFLAPDEASTKKEMDFPLVLTGMFKAGTNSYVCLLDTQKRKSYVFSVGIKVDGLEILSCDPKTESAVVQVGTEIHALKMKHSQPGRTPAQPAAANPVPGIASTTPTTPPPTPPPALTEENKAAAKLLTKEEQEQEARLLLGDIMAVTQKHRLAYEEKQRKEAEAAAAAKQKK